MKNNVLNLVATILLIVGGLNWGLFAFGVNLVTILSFGVGAIATIIYLLVALSAVYKLFTLEA